MKTNKNILVSISSILILVILIMGGTYLKAAAGTCNTFNNTNLCTGSGSCPCDCPGFPTQTGTCTGGYCLKTCPSCPSTSCITGYKCCSGTCKFGNCCLSTASTDCPGQACISNSCAPCTDDYQCGTVPGHKCCPGGTCEAVNCCNDADCSTTPATPICSASTHNCVACANDVECGTGKKCCANGCQTGTCCPSSIPGSGSTSPDCNDPTPICLGNNCQACTNSSQCNSGKKCCGGTCKDCCTTADCFGGLVCVSNTCTTLPPLCGDGLTQSPETCDDGNTNTGDGCNSSCQVESGWSCTPASPSFCCKSNGATCSAPSVCCSGNCPSGTCQPVGTPPPTCVNLTQSCLTLPCCAGQGTCSAGTCQAGGGGGGLPLGAPCSSSINAIGCTNPSLSLGTCSAPNTCRWVPTVFGCQCKP